MSINEKDFKEDMSELTSDSEGNAQFERDDTFDFQSPDDTKTDLSSSCIDLPIADLDDLMKYAVTDTMFNRTGNPEFTPLGDLDDHTVTAELERLLRILADYNIVVKFRFNYDDITKYRFITEELFEMTFQHLDIDGMKYCFRYEDYHPNNKGNIEYLSEHFLRLLLSDKWEPIVTEYMMAMNINVNGRTISRSEFAQLADTFRTNLSPASPAEIHHRQISFDSEEMTGCAEGYMNVVARNDSDSEVELVRDFRFGFRYLDDCWKISAVSIEGLEFDKIE